MLETWRRLSVRTLDALAELEARTVEADGGRLKLEWGMLRARTSHDVEDFLWWEADRLVGFLGLYAFGSPTVEVAGMVDPRWRRRGIASALLDAALPVCGERGYGQALLVVPRSSAAGRCLALDRGAVLEHSEHSLVLTSTPVGRDVDAGIALRTASPADVPALSGLLTAAFGAAPAPELWERLVSESERTLVVEVDGRTVGTARLVHEGDTGGVYGLAIDPAWQGRGIGRHVLRRVCRQLRDEGAQTVHLEVAVDNDRALGLYTSIGFSHVSTEDYYSLVLT